MNDREKLFHLITDAENPAWGDFISNKHILEFADHLIANGVTVQKWIPVTEPPEVRGEYIVYTPTAWDDRTVLIWDEQDWCFMD